MSSTQVGISEILGELHEYSPAGYAIGLQINYTTPKFMFQTYSKEWLDIYAEKGLLMSDPTLAWGFENVGVTRWAALSDQDHAGVLKLAAEYDIKFGITCAEETIAKADGIRSVGSFARNDRDFTDGEVAEIMSRFKTLHTATETQAQLSPDVVEQLRKMSILVTHPGS
ncbi:MAG: autoinducer binding domain-containing protein [Pseudomonadota bacterium]